MYGFDFGKMEVDPVVVLAKDFFKDLEVDVFQQPILSILLD